MSLPKIFTEMFGTTQLVSFPILAAHCFMSKDAYPVIVGQEIGYE